MKTLTVLMAIFCSLPTFAAWTGDGEPLKYISSCELDLNKDETSDLVFLVETIEGRELIALLREKNNLKALSLWKGPASNRMHLSCQTNKIEVKETQAAAADNPGKTHKTNGSTIQLAKAESGSMTFFWEKSQFKKISTGD